MAGSTNIKLFASCRHAEVMKKIISTVQDGGGEVGVHMYLFMKNSLLFCVAQLGLKKKLC